MENLSDDQMKIEKDNIIFDILNNENVSFDDANIKADEMIKNYYFKKIIKK